MISLQAMSSPENRAKFEHVYRTYRGLMFHIANDILHNEQDAEDAVHNAFLSIAKNIDKISDPRSPRTRGYVSIVCESRSIDLYRKRRKEQGEPLPDPDAFPSAEAEAPGGHDLVWCMLQLSPRDREILLLKYEHGYTVQEIAEILDISPQAASQRDQRAKARLNALCEKAGLL